jgi:hypothetical protein
VNRLDESDLRDLFAAVVAPPGRLTGHDAVVLGRRGVRNRRAGIAGACLLVAVIVVVALAVPGGVGHRRALLPAVTVSGPPSVWPSETPTGPAVCRPTELAYPAGITTGALEDVDPTGRWIVGIGTGSTSSADVPIVWHDGVPDIVPVPTGSRIQLFSLSVNWTGEVAGSVEYPTGRSAAFVYAGGTTTILTVPDAWQARFVEASDINSRGDVLGYAETPGAGKRTVVWRAADRTRPVVLATSDRMSASAIGDGGIVVGGGISDTQPSFPYLWNASGVGHQLSETPGTTGGGADGIHGNYIDGVLGNSRSDGNQLVRWDVRTGAYTVVAALRAVSLTDGNARGDMVAYSNAGATTGTYVYIDGLPATIVKPLHAVKVGVNVRISDTRMLIGNVTLSTQREAPYVPFVWNC